MENKENVNIIDFSLKEENLQIIDCKLSPIKLDVLEAFTRASYRRIESPTSRVRLLNTVKTYERCRIFYH